MTEPGAGEQALVRSAVVGVGDELVYGQTVDTNGAWLSRELNGLGFSVAHRTVVGDVPSSIGDALEGALEAAEVVLVTGGLGPTPDDLTREAVAELLGLPLELDSALLTSLEARFRARGYRELPPTSRAVALVPRGATVLANPRGAAPGLVLEPRPGAVLILLPGVPAEMRDLFRLGVTPFLLERLGPRLRPAVHRVILTTGIPESVLAHRIAERFPEGTTPVSLAYLPDLHGLRLRLTVRADLQEARALEALDRVEDALATILEPFQYRAESGDLSEAVGQALLERGASVAVAESCTGGLVARRLTDRPGASRYFRGGVVAYEDRLKEELLGVDRSVLERSGAVSREVAEAMAMGVAGRLGTRVGIGVTGIAGPEGGTAEKPVGTVWFAASVDGRVEARRERFLGDRGEVRERAAQAALHLLLNTLQERVP